MVGAIPPSITLPKGVSVEQAAGRNPSFNSYSMGIRDVVGMRTGKQLSMDKVR